MTREQIVTENRELTAELEALKAGQSDEIEALKSDLRAARLEAVEARRKAQSATPPKVEPVSLWGTYNELEGAAKTAFWRANSEAMAAELQTKKEG